MFRVQGMRTDEIGSAKSETLATGARISEIIVCQACFVLVDSSNDTSQATAGGWHLKDLPPMNRRSADCAGRWCNGFRFGNESR